MIAVEISKPPNALSDKDRTTCKCTWDNLEDEEFVSKENEKHRAHWSQYLHEFGLLRGDISEVRASDAELRSLKQKVKVCLATAEDANGEALTFSEKDEKVDGRQLKCKWSAWYTMISPVCCLLLVACCRSAP
jgi:hypothetical protein